jgi:hypothetical protein
VSLPRPPLTTERRLGTGAVLRAGSTAPYRAVAVVDGEPHIVRNDFGVAGAGPGGDPAAGPAPAAAAGRPLLCLVHLTAVQLADVQSVVIEPLRFSYEIDCPADHAFDVWTNQLRTWWPKGHSTSGDDTVVRLEPRLGGRIFERTSDGNEIDWGEVARWSPPSASATRGTSAERAGTPPTSTSPSSTSAARRTRLEIVHSGWDRLVEGDAWRNATPAGGAR